MIVRPLRASDVPILREFHRQQGFPYDFPDLFSPLIECVDVVVDENDQPLCAVAAERVVQLYFLSGDFGPVHARFHALKLLHVSVATKLKANGYTEANGFLPPAISPRFGRWLERKFGWIKNWPSWACRF